MGTTTSRLEDSPPSRTRRSSLSSFFVCGCSSSQTSLGMEEYPEILESSSRHSNSVIDVIQKPEGESSSKKGKETHSSRANAEISILSESGVSEYVPILDVSSNVDASSKGKHLIKTEDLLAPCKVKVDLNYGEHSRDRNSVAASSSSAAVNVLVSSVKEPVSNIGSAPRSPPRVSNENHLDNVIALRNAGPHFVSPVSNQPDSGSPTEATTSIGLGFLVSDRAGGHRDESLRYVDAVSIRSNSLSSANGATNGEARRDSRRQFWDAFSRRGFGRLSESPTTRSSNDDGSDRGSLNRWLFDFNGSLSSDGVRSDSTYLRSRTHIINERRQQSRSEIWERLYGGTNEPDQTNTLCPFGLHLDGPCSCESFLMSDDESSIRASISRIVMLAEALFEVLDEIHSQAGTLSLSRVSLPAPEAVVDSFPLKNHKKVNSPGSEDDVEQCYICLADYEDGDQIRVLPCHHDYHMSCVDKWLKEIHGVCPLCRANVCEGSTTEIPISETLS